MVPIAGVTGPTLMSDAPTTLPGQLSDADMCRIWREKFGNYDEQSTVSVSRNEMRLKDEEIGRLRAILRVNLLRHVPGVTHAEIDALLDGSLQELGL